MTTSPRSLGEIELARDRQRGQWMVAGDHDDADAGPLGRGDGVLRLWPQRVDQRGQPEQAQPGELLLGSRRDRPGGDRDHAIPGGGKPLGG